MRERECRLRSALALAAQPNAGEALESALGPQLDRPEPGDAVAAGRAADSFRSNSHTRAATRVAPVRE